MARTSCRAAGPARYAVLKWLFMQAASMGPALGNHSHFRQSADTQRICRRTFPADGRAELIARLMCGWREAPYLGGDAYSIADMAAWPWARYFHRHGMKDADCPHLIDWMTRVGERPAVRATDAPIKAFAAQDSADQKAASPQEFAMFMGHHIPAPTRRQRRLPECATTLRGEA